MNFKFVDYWLNIFTSYTCKLVFVLSVKVVVNGKIEDSIIRKYFLLILFMVLNFRYTISDFIPRSECMSIINKSRSYCNYYLMPHIRVVKTIF